MLGTLPSRTVITICLFVAICTLFLRGIVYRNLHQPEISKAAENPTHGSSPIILAYHERPPYYTTDDAHSLTGLLGKPALAAFRHSGLDFTVQHMPSSRQLNSIRSNTERICAVGWFKTPERERYARFTKPLYQDLPTSVLTRADIDFPQTQPTLQQLLALTDLTLLLKSGYSYGQYIDQGLQHSTPNIITTTGSTDRMLEMIATGRADYFFLAAEEAEAAIAASNSPEAYRVLTLIDIPQGNRRYIICSRQVAPHEISRLNQAIASTAPGGIAGQK